VGGKLAEQETSRLVPEFAPGDASWKFNKPKQSCGADIPVRCRWSCGAGPSPAAADFTRQGVL